MTKEINSSNEQFNKLYLELSDPELIGEIHVTCQLRLPLLLGSGKITQEEYEKLLKAAIKNINNQIPIHKKGVIYHNEKTKRGWEISVTVDRLRNLLPPQHARTSQTYVVDFDEKDTADGLNVSFSADSVWGTGKNSLIRVTERTLLVLRVLEIPYKIVDL